MKTHRVVFRAVDRDKFEEVRGGIKIIETRAGTPKYQAIQRGDELLFICSKDRFTKRIIEVRHYGSLDAMFDALPLSKILPSVTTREAAYKVYFGFPGYKEKLAEHGVLAFILEQ